MNLHFKIDGKACHTNPKEAVQYDVSGHNQK